jgi:hypothetical protein
MGCRRVSKSRSKQRKRMENGMAIYKQNAENHKLFLKIKELYCQSRLPLINGIITKEKYIEIAISEHKIISFTEREIDKNISLLEEDCSCIDIFNKIEYQKFVLACGEGSYGGDGFITIADKENNLLWVMFHEKINPIEKMVIENNKIIGINNCALKYEFAINWETLP